MTTRWTHAAERRLETYLARLRDQLKTAAEQLARERVCMVDVDAAYLGLSTLPEKPHDDR